MGHRCLARVALLCAALLAVLVLVPSAARAASVLNQGDTLAVGQKLVSPDGHVALVLDSTGNLALYAGYYATWTSGTAGPKVDYYLRFSSACNLSVRKGGGTAPCRSPIPRQADHRFHGKPITDSTASRSLNARAVLGRQ